MSRIKKWKDKYNSETVGNLYNSTKAMAVRLETQHTKRLVEIEQSIKPLINKLPSILHHYYMVFGKEAYSKTLKHINETLHEELCILEKKWEMRGLNVDILEEILSTIIKNHSICEVPPIKIPYPNGRVFFFGLYANMPTGWEQDNNYGTKYLQGGAADFLAPANGGSTNHNHVLPAHTHGGSLHIHRISAGSASLLTSQVDIAGAPTVCIAGVTANHSHGLSMSAGATLNYTNNAPNNLTNATSGAIAVRPILIKPLNENQDIPIGASCYTDETVIPTGFSTQAALNDKFMVPVNAGVNGSTVSIGSATHQHTLNPNHNHPISNHSHPNSFCRSGTNQEVFCYSLIRDYIDQIHHLISLDNGAAGNSGNAAPNSDLFSNDPAYTKLLGVYNSSGSQTTPKNIVIMFIGAIGDIPTGWKLMDGTGDSKVNCIDKQIKATTNTGEIGNIGGSNTHTHIMSHTHTSMGSHNHTSTISGAGNVYKAAPGFGFVSRNNLHTHSWTIGASTPGASDNNDAITNAKDVRKDYRTIIYIKKIID